MKRWPNKLCAGLVLWVWHAHAHAAPVLHEYFDESSPGAEPPSAPPRPTQAPAAALGAGANAAGPPGASGSATPLPGWGVDAAGAAPITEYGAPSVADRGYQLDANTTMPGNVAYDDPFSPAIPPFKRLFAFDTVDESLTLAVADRRPRPIQAGASPRADEDQFFAELEVVVDELGRVRLPTVGPGTRLLAAELTPSVSLEIAEDSAENWTARVGRAGRYHLVMHLAIERAVFGSPFAATTWEQLAPYSPRLPDAALRAAGPVLARLGVSRAMAPRAAVAKLIEYFRGFEPTEVVRPQQDMAKLYQDVALGRTGVCRHRAYAFVLTALALGLPARFVHNEAHAWVEVRDLERWHRVDLGGAAGAMQLATRVEVRHSPPQDPYAWPAVSQSGTEMADAALGGGQPSSAPGASSVAPSGTPSQSEGPAEAEAKDEPGSASPDDADEPPGGPGASAVLTLRVGAAAAMRGDGVALSGQASNAAGPCVLVPVAVYLEGAEPSAAIRIGTLATDHVGHFGGTITLPAQLPLGDYELVVRTDGSSACGAGEAR